MVGLDYSHVMPPELDTVITRNLKSIDLRLFCLCRAAAHIDWCFFAPCINIITYLLTYLLQHTS